MVMKNIMQRNYAKGYETLPQKILATRYSRALLNKLVAEDG